MCQRREAIAETLPISTLGSTRSTPWETLRKHDGLRLTYQLHQSERLMTRSRASRLRRSFMTSEAGPDESKTMHCRVIHIMCTKPRVTNSRTLVLRRQMGLPQTSSQVFPVQLQLGSKFNLGFPAAPLQFAVRCSVVGHRRLNEKHKRRVKTKGSATDDSFVSEQDSFTVISGVIAGCSTILPKSKVLDSLASSPEI